MDANHLALAAAELMDSIESDGVEVGTVLIIAEIHGKNESGEEYTTFRSRCTDGRLWVQRAIVHELLHEMMK